MGLVPCTGKTRSRIVRGAGNYAAERLFSLYFF